MHLETQCVLILLSLFTGFFQYGCFTFGDTVEGMSKSDADRRGAGGDTGSGIDTVGSSDTQTGTDTDPTSNAGSDPEASGDAGSNGDTGMDTDTDIDTDTDVDTANDVDTGREVDSDSETNDVFECGTPDECGDFYTCISNSCVFCDENDSCGAKCDPCDRLDGQPECVLNVPGDAHRGTRCVCSETSCPAGEYCNPIEGVCAPCVVDEACGPVCDSCGGETPMCRGDNADEAVCVCSGAVETEDDSCFFGQDERGDAGIVGHGRYCNDASGECEACITEDACGPSCLPCAGKRTWCVGGNTEEARCVECRDYIDCGQGTPFNSPLGLCTPNHECTCKVETKQSECTSSAHCNFGNDTDDPNYFCAADAPSHFVCLKKCDLSVATQPYDGFSCRQSVEVAGGDVLVWAPMTTCYAYWNFLEEKPCNSPHECSVDDTDGIDDAECTLDGICTYSCYDEAANEPVSARCPGSRCDFKDNQCIPLSEQQP